MMSAQAEACCRRQGHALRAGDENRTPPVNCAPSKLTLLPENCASLKSPVSKIMPVKFRSRHQTVALSLRCAMLGYGTA